MEFNINKLNGMSDKMNKIRQVSLDRLLSMNISEKDNYMEIVNSVFVETMVEIEQMSDIQYDCVDEGVRVTFREEYIFGYFTMPAIITVLGMIKAITIDYPDPKSQKEMLLNFADFAKTYPKELVVC